MFAESDRVIHRAYLGLGSNLDNPAQQIETALRHLSDEPGIRLIQCSPFYQTEPVGFRDQNWFVNAVAAIETSLRPPALLDVCLAIEHKMGRVRDPLHQYAPRRIDIDILFYGQFVIQLPQLEIPHPRVHERAFTLAPLLDLAPELMHPVLQKTIRQFYKDLPRTQQIIEMSL